ncbi:MAG: DUF4093 domain-containing protein [Oscillibacter sp.]|nr:DUF4093 domain-containing protein [Oscillibacter sp.]
MKRRIQEAIVVEGRYDKNALAQVVDAPVITLEGFAAFHNQEKLAYLRRLAQTRGLILLTDSDGAGFLLRGWLKGALPPEHVKQAYIPEVAGKERRKRKGGRAGLLGVEGMRPEVLLEVLERAGATFLDDTETEKRQPAKPADASPVTKADLFAWGLSGRPDSAQRRETLLVRLDLPRKLNANAMLEALHLLYTRAELEALVRECFETKDE